MNLRKICVGLIVILMFIATSVSAYSTDSYTVDIDEEVYEVAEEEGLVLFQKISGDNIVIQEIEKKLIGGKLTQYQLNNISDEIVTQYQSQYQAKVEEVGREEVVINGHKVTKMSFETKISEYMIYQEMNIFVSSNRVFDIIFTTVSENGFSDEEKNKILNSFVILGEELTTGATEELITTESTETTTEQKMDQIWIQFLAFIIVAVILMIVAIKRNPKSKLYWISIVLLLLQGLAIKSAEMQGITADDLNSNIGKNIGFFILAIISIILLIIQSCKKNKKVEAKPEDVTTLEETKKTIQESNDNENK